MNTPTLTASTLAPLPSPDGSPFRLAPNGNARRQAVQTYLYHTQFYKGRQDGLPDDERMDAAIKLVQIAAHLPVTGVFGDAERDAVLRYRDMHSFRSYADTFAQGALKEPSQIVWAQRALAALGHYPKTGPFDGEASLALVNAFRAFERANANLLGDEHRYSWLPTEKTVQAVRSALTAKGLSPDTPGGLIGTMSPPKSFLRDLATFAILTSPAWGLLLFIQRPWTKLRLPGGAMRRRSTR